jgi:hypothetical protein
LFFIKKSFSFGSGVVGQGMYEIGTKLYPVEKYVEGKFP